MIELFTFSLSLLLGIPDKLDDNADRMLLLAQDMIITLKEISDSRKVDLKVRIGIHNGKVSSGVIGMKKFIYDVWSDDVAIASKMESTGEPNTIQISSSVRMRLKLGFRFSEGQSVDLGKLGHTQTFFLDPREFFCPSFN